MKNYASFNIIIVVFINIVIVFYKNNIFYFTFTRFQPYFAVLIVCFLLPCLANIIQLLYFYIMVNG
jgi:hypothetical protein